MFKLTPEALTAITQVHGMRKQAELGGPNAAAGYNNTPQPAPALVPHI